MPSLKQIEANRRNAQKSTGPRTLRGKAVSRFNALKSAVFACSETTRGEDSLELQDLADLYTDRWDPRLPEERALVDVLIHSEWQLRRLRRAEAALWAHSQNEYCTWDGAKTPSVMGAALARDGAEFVRLQRRIDATQRAYARTLATLTAMAAQAAAATEADEAAEEAAVAPATLPAAPAAALLDALAPIAEPPRNQYPARQNGFVPQILLRPSALAAAPPGRPSPSAPLDPAPLDAVPL